MPTPSIAVLPFVDRSPGRDQAHLGEGLAAELIGALLRVAGLSVTSRNVSFRLRGDEPPGVVGRRLDVSNVVRGEVGRSDDRVCVAVRLFRVDDGAELWSRTFDCPLADLFQIQRQVAEGIAATLDLGFEPRHAEALRRPPTSDIEAYEYYLKGRERFFEHRRHGIEEALVCFERALDLDPGYARAWAGVAECHCFLVMYAGGDETNLARADTASRRALEVAPELAEAHVARGLLLSLQERYRESEQAFETAIGLNPRLFEAFYLYGRNSFAQGDLEGAAKLYGHASRIDPDDYQVPLLLGQILVDLGRPEEAEKVRRLGVAAAERRLELHPRETRALYMAGNALVCLGERQEGVLWAERALELEPDESMVLYNAACIFSLAGESERALDCLEKAAVGGAGYLDWIRQDSNLDPLRGHPRFQALLASP